MIDGIETKIGSSSRAITDPFSNQPVYNLVVYGVKSLDSLLQFFFFFLKKKLSHRAIVLPNNAHNGIDGSSFGAVR